MRVKSSTTITPNCYNSHRNCYSESGQNNEFLLESTPPFSKYFQGKKNNKNKGSVLSPNYSQFIEIHGILALEFQKRKMTKLNKHTKGKLW